MLTRSSTPSGLVRSPLLMIATTGLIMVAGLQGGFAIVQSSTSSNLSDRREHCDCGLKATQTPDDDGSTSLSGGINVSDLGTSEGNGEPA
jgi:hypothetical protein